MSYRYKLASNKVKKIDCPHCGARSHWQRYIDIETGEVLPAEIGKCDNENKCGVHITPKDAGYAKEVFLQEKYKYKNYRLPVKNKFTALPKIKPQFIDTQILTKGVFIFEGIGFGKKLVSKFGQKTVDEVLKNYRIGEIKTGNRKGATIMPYIDIEGRIRAIQVKQFDADNHTVKNGNDWLHSILAKNYAKSNEPLPEWLNNYMKQEKKVTCLFGEHLLSKYKNNPVGLVEAPKTAIYATLYLGLPANANNMLWLAVGGKSWLNEENIKALTGRNVYVFPDLSIGGKTYDEWEAKFRGYSKAMPGTTFTLSNYLENIATDKQRTTGADLADILENLQI